MKRYTSAQYMTTIFGIMTLIGFGWPARAALATTVWSSVAAGCVLDSASAPLANVDATFGTVSFKGTRIGHIHLTCPVNVPVQIPAGYVAMGTNYYDPDFMGTKCQVKAILLRTNLNELERGNTIVQIDSNTDTLATEPGTGRSLAYAQIPENIDSTTSYYWVELDLFRSSTSCNPTSVGAYLLR